MFRRIVSFVVVLGLLAGNLAAVPHAHGSMTATEQATHDSTPHFHLPFGAVEHAAHSHAHGHHCHHKHSHVSGHAVTAKAPSASGKCAVAHDSNAIYLSTVVGLYEAVKVDPAGSISSLPLDSLVVSLLAIQPSLRPAQWAWRNASGSLGDAAPLYLTLRTLRI